MQECGEQYRLRDSANRGAAREFGISRETVRKMLRYSIPPGYSRLQPGQRPKLEAWIGIIDQILEEDRSRRPNSDIKVRISR